MIKGEEFYSAMRARGNVFKKFGLKKKDRSSFMLPNDIKLQFLLDRWGWDEENGHGFHVRLSDMKQQDKWGNVLGFDARVDVHPINLIEEGLISKDELLSVYSRHPALQNKILESSWFLFYDANELDDLLDAVLPAMLGYAKAWQPAPQN